MLWRLTMPRWSNGLRVCGLLSVALCAACSSDGSAERQDSAEETRLLSRDVLMSAGASPLPVPNSEFRPPSGALPPAASFAGRLQLRVTAGATEYTILHDELGLAKNHESAIGSLPDFDFEWLQDGNLLVPVMQGPVRNDHPFWEYVLRPGAVWREQGDNGLSRAVIPFALKERGEDCIHNGLMTFLFGEPGEVSDVAFQLVSETCKYLQLDMYGVVAAEYLPGAVSAGSDAVASVRRNRAAQMQQRPIDTLVSDYPGINSDAFGSREEIMPADMTAYGFVVDDKHYVGGCQTRYGEYPACDELALPSYSTAKSLLAGLGLMLAEKHHPGIADSSIARSVPECRETWTAVSIENALDMTTGHYGSTDLHVDEDAALQSRFFTSVLHADKINYACREYSRGAAPGRYWVYQSWATYLFGTALNARLSSLRGRTTDYVADLLQPEVFEPLALTQLAQNIRRTYDDVAQPYSAYGMTFVRDDVARLAKLVGADEGRIDGEPVLQGSLFDAIKQRLPEDPGLVAEFETMRYNNGFRSFDVSAQLGCAQPAWLVVMSGYGGISVVIMPNNTLYYYFSDGGEFRYLSAVKESHKLRSMCSA